MTTNNKFEGSDDNNRIFNEEEISTPVGETEVQHLPRQS